MALTEAGVQTRALLRGALGTVCCGLVLCGMLYPALITGLGSRIFPQQARGSRVWQDDQIRGSRLMGQPFSHPKYLWGRSGGSASGKDPDITWQAAAAQIPRIAQARGSTESAIQALLKQHTQPQCAGSPARICVLSFNLALDAADPTAAR